MGKNTITLVVKNEAGEILLQAETYDEYDAAALLTSWKRRNE